MIDILFAGDREMLQMHGNGLFWFGRCKFLQFQIDMLSEEWREGSAEFHVALQHLEEGSECRQFIFIHAARPKSPSGSPDKPVVQFIYESQNSFGSAVKQISVHAFLHLHSCIMQGGQDPFIQFVADDTRRHLDAFHLAERGGSILVIEMIPQYFEIRIMGNDQDGFSCFFFYDVHISCHLFARSRNQFSVHDDRDILFPMDFEYLLDDLSGLLGPQKCGCIDDVWIGPQNHFNVLLAFHLFQSLWHERGVCLLS